MTSQPSEDEEYICKVCVKRKAAQKAKQRQRAKLAAQKAKDQVSSSQNVKQESAAPKEEPVESKEDVKPAKLVPVALMRVETACSKEGTVKEEPIEIQKEEPMEVQDTESKPALPIPEPMETSLETVKPATMVASNVTVQKTEEVKNKTSPTERTHVEASPTRDQTGSVTAPVPVDVKPCDVEMVRVEDDKDTTHLAPISNPQIRVTHPCDDVKVVQEKSHPISLKAVQEETANVSHIQPLPSEPVKAGLQVDEKVDSRSKDDIIEVNMTAKRQEDPPAQMPESSKDAVSKDTAVLEDLETNDASKVGGVCEEIDAKDAAANSSLTVSDTASDLMSAAKDFPSKSNTESMPISEHTEQSQIPAESQATELGSEVSSPHQAVEPQPLSVDVKDDVIMSEKDAGQEVNPPPPRESNNETIERQQEAKGDVEMKEEEDVAFTHHPEVTLQKPSDPVESSQVDLSPPSPPRVFADNQNDEKDTTPTANLPSATPVSIESGIKDADCKSVEGGTHPVVSMETAQVVDMALSQVSESASSVITLPVSGDVRCTENMTPRTESQPEVGVQKQEASEDQS